MKKKKRGRVRLNSKAHRSGHRRPNPGSPKPAQQYLSGRRRLPFKAPTTARQYFALSQQDQAMWDSLAHVIARIKDGEPLRKASKEYGIPPSIVAELGRSALRKKNRRYVATKFDQLLRVVPILKRKGKQVIATRDSRQASVIGSYWAAVQRHLQTGDDSALLKFKKVRIVDASGKRHRLLTDLAELNRQASAGVLSFESLYGGSR